MKYGIIKNNIFIATIHADRYDCFDGVAFYKDGIKIVEIPFGTEVKIVEGDGDYFKRKTEIDVPKRNTEDQLHSLMINHLELKAEIFRINSEILELKKYIDGR